MSDELQSAAQAVVDKTNEVADKVTDVAHDAVDAAKILGGAAVAVSKTVNTVAADVSAIETSLVPVIAVLKGTLPYLEKVSVAVKNGVVYFIRTIHDDAKALINYIHKL